VADTAEILELNDDCDDLGIVVATPDWATDDLFWRTVTGDAMEREWKYGTDEHAELADDNDEYVEARVADWVRSRVEAPAWKWWYRQPNPDWDPDLPHEDENPQWFLVACEQDQEGAFHGALITPTSEENSRG
jgi:hypothetical protein